MATMLTGEQLEEVKQQASEHFWPHARQAGNVSDDTGLKIVTDAQGVWVNDAAGEPWFDLISGMFLKNIGHGRKEIADAVYEQMQGISYSPGGTVTPATAQLAARVAGLAPDKNSRLYFVSGGSEAVETALKMAKQYHNNNGEASRWKVLSRKGSYHGATHACMSLGQSGGRGRADRPADARKHTRRPARPVQGHMRRRRRQLQPGMRKRNRPCHRTRRPQDGRCVHRRANLYGRRDPTFRTLTTGPRSGRYATSTA